METLTHDLFAAFKIPYKTVQTGGKSYTKS